MIVMNRQKGEGEEWRQKYYDLSEKLKRRKESKRRVRAEGRFFE